MKGHKSHHHGHHKAGGGRIGMKVSGNPDVFKEAEDKEPYESGDKPKRKHGGKVHHMDGHKSKHRADRPKRKHGGGVGADHTPLSSAHTVKSAARETAGGQPD